MTIAVSTGGTGLAGFEVACPPVPRRLAPFVASWIGYREWSCRPVQRLEHPTGRAVLIVELGEPVAVGRTPGAWSRFDAGFFAGIDDAPSITRFEEMQAGVQLTLTPLGAYALAGGGLSSLTRQVVEVASVRLPRSLADQLRETATWAARFHLVETALAARFEGSRELSAVVRWALERIDARRGAVRIDALCRELGFSRKYLHERFVREVGVSPKRYSELRRFGHVLDRLRAGRADRPGRLTFARLATETGHADQAHLAREVRRFAGASTSGLEVALQDPLGHAIQTLASSVE